MKFNKKILFVLTSAVLTALLIFCSLRVVSLTRRVEALESIIKAEQVSSLSKPPFLRQEKVAPLDESKHKVLSVIDGDTITIETTAGSLKVRVIGIDTPETVHPSKPVERGGPEASNRTKELLEGQTVVIHYDSDPNHGKWGKYSRLLAYLELPDGSDFGLVMIEEGFARVYPKYPFSRQKTYLKAEERAKQGRCGIWAEQPDPCEPVTNNF